MYEGNQLPFMASAKVGNKIFFSAWHVNGLFYLDDRTQKVQFVTCFQEERVTGLHIKAFLYRDKIYYIPAYGEHISCLNLEDMKVNTIYLPDGGRESDLSKFSNVLYADEALWLIPYGYGAIVRLNLQNNKLEKYEYSRENGEQVQWGHQLFSGSLFSKEHNLICMCPYEGDCFVTLNVKTKEIKLHHLDYPEHSFVEIILHKENIWFIPRGEYPYIVKYHTTSGTVQKIKVDILEDEKPIYYCAAVVGSMILMPPYQGKHWLCVHMDTGVVKTFRMKQEEQSGLSEPYYQAVSDLGDSTLISSDYNPWAWRVWKHQRKWEKIYFAMSNDVKLEMITNLIEEGKIAQTTYTVSGHNFFKEKTLGLEVYLELILGGIKEKNLPIDADGAEKIHSHICRRLLEINEMEDARNESTNDI